jgi:hypothetical protein
MSAGAGNGHLKAAEALALSFSADARVAEVIIYSPRRTRSFFLRVPHLSKLPQILRLEII